MGKAAMMVAAGPSHLNSGELSRVDVLGILYEGGSGGRLNSRDLSRNPVTARRRPPEQEIWLIAIPDPTFVVSGALFAVMDYIADTRGEVYLAAEKSYLEVRKAEVGQGLRPGTAAAQDPTGG